MAKSEPEHFRLDYHNTLRFYAQTLTSANVDGTAALNAAKKQLGETDLFFLLVFVLKRADIMHPWLFERCREVQRAPNGHIDLWAREHYKAVDVNEPVPTPTGFKRHGDLMPGDWVFGADGDPTRVVAKTEVFNDADCYRVTFDDGCSVMVSGDHLWTVRRKTRKRLGKGRMYRETVTINTRDMAAHDHKQDNRLSIPVAPAVMQIEHMLPLDPYTLGAWLGDGSSDTNVLTCGDSEVFDEIRKAYEVSDGRPSKDITRTIYGIRPILRELSLMGNKHIPRDYLVASIAQRRALLQGLMDTDGTCDTRGTATFVNKNKALADGVFDLAASLGLKPRFNTYHPDHGDVFYVSFQAYKADEPFKIRRKMARCKDGERSARRFIISIEPIASIPVSCIQVDRPDGLYLIGRNHVTTHNSTIITFGLTIFDIINNPEITIGIFSHTKPVAKKFLGQIKSEMELNPDLHLFWPDVFWENPKSQAPKWSEDGGLILKRDGNPKEATLEAHGLVDGQPTGRHFKLMIYDDVVTMESVSTPEQINKTTNAWRMSDNLGAAGGDVRVIGTRYHLFDTYRTMLDDKVAIPRIHAATKNGLEHGEPVLMSRELLALKRQKQGPYVFSSQMLLDPTADKAMGFRTQWLVYADTDYHAAMRSLWRFIIVDPAGGKQRKNNDYTTMFVIGHGEDLKYRILDIRRDRLNLSGKSSTLMALHRHWKPHLVAYEEYGMQADIEHIQYVQEQELYEFDITPLGGSMRKELRILQLVPHFENGYVEGGEPKSRIILPTSCQQLDYQGVNRNLVKDLVEEEYTAFPVLAHDDMLDCLARICDLEAMGLIETPKVVAAPMYGNRTTEGLKNTGNSAGTDSWLTA